MSTTVTPFYDPLVHTPCDDPYSVYQWLRDEAPVYHNAERGIWALSRFDDVMAAALDARSFISGEGIQVTAAHGSPMPTLITTDNPRHDQLRKLVSRGFTARQTGTFEPRVRAAARQLVDAFVADGHVDLVEAFTGPLPIIVISELLGVEPDAREDFKRWSDAAVRQNPDRPETGAAATAAYRSINAYFTDVIAARRRRPTDDMASHLLAAEVDGEALTDDEILGFCFLLIVAGTETTTNLIGNGVIALARHPEQRERLRSHAELLPQAVEEMLRWCGPVHQLGRTTATDVTMHGITIPAGEKVALLWASANRDEREFGARAGSFDTTRLVGRHVAFGYGTHFCLGASLARLEGRLAIEELLQRLPDWDIAGEVTYAPSPSVRGPLRLPLTFG